MLFINILLAISLAGCGRVGFSSSDSGGAQPYPSAVLADLPKSYYRLDDSGALAADLTTRVAGTYIGNCTHQVPGAIVGDSDTATEFDGTSCEVALGDNFGFTTTAVFTIELWFKPAQAVAYGHLFSMATRSGTGVGGPVDGYSLFQDNGQLGFFDERAVSGTNLRNGPAAVTAGRWTYLVFRYDGAHIELFVDSIKASSTPDARSMPTYSSTALIGAHTQGAFASGVIDEVAVYPHLLSDARITAHYTIGATGGP